MIKKIFPRSTGESVSNDSQDLSHGRDIYVKQIHLDIKSSCTFRLFSLLPYLKYALHYF